MSDDADHNDAAAAAAVTASNDWHITEDEECIWRVPTVALDHTKRIVAYDLDGTLIRPASGRKMPLDFADWTWLHEDVVPALIDEAHKSNLVIFTNQANLRSPSSLRAFAQTKLNAVLAALKTQGVDIAAFVAGGYSRYRKPKTTMWDLYLTTTGLTPTHRDVFVGDAAGRLDDHAASDRQMAHNAVLQFQTPEEYYNDVRDPLLPELVHPLDMVEEHAGPPKRRFMPSRRELIIMCGSPASGKSAWIREHVPERYTVISQDLHGAKSKCIRMVAAALERGESVVVDNTHCNRAVRAEYLAPAKAIGVQARCVWLDTPRQVSDHLNAMRVDHPETPKPRVPEQGVRAFWSKFEPPTESEGFREVFQVPWMSQSHITPPEHMRRFHG